ncbi:hypothetical protein E4T44_09946 [Aureobasidium sp. EXF-8845]|nr:hypothetical protein E4T44_09946 [Aureobasidium sp. EXF-8845]KAI4837548.1 hypothetical protein E4T45_09811 [Aureobasidium sp. EXF-8846]
MKQMQELVDLAEKNGVKTIFGSQGQAHPAVHLIKKMIAEDKIGKPLSTTLIATTGLPLDRPLPVAFKMLAERKAGGNFATIWYLHSPSFSGEPGCRWTINGSKGDIQITNPRGCFDIEHAGIEIKYKESGEKESEVVELEEDELSSLEHPAQNVGRLYEAYAKGETGSYADWKVALRRHKFVDEVFERADGKECFGEPAAYMSR